MSKRMTKAEALRLKRLAAAERWLRKHKIIFVPLKKGKS